MFWKPGLSIGMACRAYRLAGREAGSDEKIGRRERENFVRCDAAHDIALFFSSFSSVDHFLFTAFCWSVLFLSQ